MNKIVKGMIAMGVALGMANSAFAAETLKLGYLVKQPEEPWFQTEWNFADKAGKDLGFEVIKIAVPDGEKTLNAIDSLAANGAKGFVICTPDPKLGAAIMAKARSMDLKVITVDDQFVNAKGQPMEQVPLVMMAATKIGERQGQELYKEMQKRQWDPKSSAVLAITADELDTARRRVEGSLGALKAAGFPEGQIHRAPTKSNDIPGALDAANLNELSKSSATGFLGSLLPSPDVHGYKSIQMLHDWVVNDAEPAKFTEVTDVVLITRDNFKAELQKKGL